MKKLFLIVLVACVFFSAPAIAEDLHLLWDIPFTVKVDEYIDLVKKKTGFELRETVSALIEETPPSPSEIRAELTQSWINPQMRIVGYNAESVTGNFNDDSLLSRTIIRWKIGADAPAEYAADCFAGILFEATQKYGKPEMLSLAVSDFDDRWMANAVYCEIENTDGYINTADIIKAQDEQNLIVCITAYFNNIKLEFELYMGEVYISRNISFQCSEKKWEPVIPELPYKLPTFSEHLAIKNKGVGF